MSRQFAFKEVVLETLHLHLQYPVHIVATVPSLMWDHKPGTTCLVSESGFVFLVEGIMVKKMLAWSVDGYARLGRLVLTSGRLLKSPIMTSLGSDVTNVCVGSMPNVIRSLTCRSMTILTRSAFLITVLFAGFFTLLVYAYLRRGQLEDKPLIFYEYNNAKAGNGVIPRAMSAKVPKSDSKIKTEPLSGHPPPPPPQPPQEQKVDLPQTPVKDKSKLQQSVLKSPKRKKGDASPKREALTRTPTRKRKREVRRTPAPWAHSLTGVWDRYQGNTEAQKISGLWRCKLSPLAAKEED